jgi:hypothetical protein
MYVTFRKQPHVKRLNIDPLAMSLLVSVDLNAQHNFFKNSKRLCKHPLTPQVHGRPHLLRPGPPQQVRQLEDGRGVLIFQNTLATTITNITTATTENLFHIYNT